jgi:hypothetical protein
LPISIGNPIRNNLRHDSREELRPFLILDFIMIIVENAASQTQVLPNNTEFQGRNFEAWETSFEIAFFKKLPEIPFQLKKKRM